MHVLRLSHISAALLLCSSVLASVIVQYPLEGQLPLIARVGNPYNWTISKNTFVSTHNASLDYAASDLPGWLAFDHLTLSFYGTPAQEDEGSHQIKMSSNESKSSDAASSSFVLLVTSTPAPKVTNPVIEQFKLPNPSLSSVYLVSQNSALRSTVPALRVPPKWSFSIGFRYDTFTSNSENVYYAALQSDGSPLPDWIVFNPESITLNGITPSTRDLSTPRSLLLALHASDQEGYSGASLPFDLFVAEHEVSLSTSSLPTINVTAETEFSISLNSAADYSGVLLDGQPIQPADIVTMQVDTSFYGEWLEYDTASRTLSGEPPDDLHEEPVLPVTIATTVNQTLETNVSIAVVPSYFTSSTLQPILVEAGNSLSFSLTPFFSNATGVNGQDDVSLSAAFDPNNSTTFLHFDPSAATISGTIPANFSDYTHITISFTAYSHITHSTSHTSLPISLTPSDYAHSHNTAGPTSLSPATKAKLLLGLKIAFGIIGGLVFFGLCLATLRRCARVQDSAVEGEAGTRAWTDEEKKWYGIGIEVNGEALGTELRRMKTRMSDESYSPGSISVVQSPGLMRKADFMGKVRSTARRVSDTVRGMSSVNKKKRPIIGKPTLIMAEDGSRANVDDLRLVQPPVVEDPFDDTNASYTPSSASGWTGASIGIPSSPSFSTGSRSIPRRRPDFAPPVTNQSPSTMLLATPPQTYVSKTHAYAQGAPLSRTSSVDTDDSDDSARTHATEAVVQRAERARSVRSGRSGSVFSFQTHPNRSQADPGPLDGATRPRLVPFTSAARVPVPKMPSTTFDPAHEQSVAGNVMGRTKRVPSQTAKVFRSVSTEKRFSQLEGAPGDELSVGIEYVRALGNNEVSPSTSLHICSRGL
jgi:axial budding pattern protein 2